MTGRRSRRPRSPARALRAGAGPAVVALACALLLVGSPAGQAGILWWHVATEHHSEPPASAPHRHGSGPEHRHSEAPEPPPAASSFEPHEHDGRVHTHEQAPAGDAVAPLDGLSKYYLGPPLPAPSRPAPGAPVAWAHAASPPQAVASIETPPPRRPV